MQLAARLMLNCKLNVLIEKCWCAGITDTEKSSLENNSGKDFFEYDFKAFCSLYNTLGEECSLYYTLQNNCILKSAQMRGII